MIYFFSANGRYLASPNDVRRAGINIRDKYAYYCKIEILVQNAPQIEQALEVTNDFLTAMLPSIMACLPDWVEANGGPPAAEVAANQPSS